LVGISIEHNENEKQQHLQYVERINFLNIFESNGKDRQDKLSCFPDIVISGFSVAHKKGTYIDEVKQDLKH
jgi:hypothetical protein